MLEKGHNEEDADMAKVSEVEDQPVDVNFRKVVGDVQYHLDVY